MSENNENKLVPRLRFPEFTYKTTWANRKLSEVLFEHKEKSTGKEEVYSVSVHKGVVNQIEHLGRTFAASNTENYKRVLPGDIIYTKSPTGCFPLGIIKQSKVSKPVIVSPLYGVFKPETIDLGLILDAYFEYPERTINYLSSIVQKGAKNTININNDTFLSKSLILPTDKLEQQKIAACLSSLDDVITAESKKLEVLKEHKKGLLQNLFPQEGETVPKLRFKEFENSGEWKEKYLNEISPAIFDGTHQTPSYTEKGVPFYSVENIKSGIKNKFISREDYLLSISKNKPEKGDIIITRIGDIGTSKVIDWNYEFSIYVTLAIVKKSTIFNSYYLHSFFQSSRYQKEILSKSLLNAVPCKINMDELRRTKILIPPDKGKKEQLKISEIFSSVDDLINSQSQKIETLKLHKKGLLQGLFPDVNEHNG